MRFDSTNLPRALELLISAMGPSRAKAGCVSCQVGDDRSDPGALLYTEEWASEGAFRRHVLSEEFWRVLVAMDLCSEEPHVTIAELTSCKGIEYLRQLRGEPAKNASQPK